MRLVIDWPRRWRRKSQAFLATHAHIRDDQGRYMIVLNGYLHERIIQAGIGDVPVRDRQVRDQRKILKANRI